MTEIDILTRRTSILGEIISNGIIVLCAIPQQKDRTSGMVLNWWTPGNEASQKLEQNDACMSVPRNPHFAIAYLYAIIYQPVCKAFRVLLMWVKKKGT